MKKYYIKDLTDKQVIHAPTHNIALKLCRKFHDLGMEWCSGRSYLDLTNWLECQENTCYEPTIGMYCSREYYEYSNYEILTIDQLLDFDEPLKTEEVQIQKKINNNVKNKYWIKDLNENQVIHAPTQEIAEKLCKKFDELGFKWCTGESYLDLINWFDYKDNTYYNPVDGSYCSKEWCEKINYEILTINQLLDFEEPLKIEVGKFYKTRGGRKVRIYSTENGGTYPVHGAIERADVWEIQSWEENGVFNEVMSPTPEDIVSEWIDELEFDVSIIPSFKYLAMDANGRWMMYSKKPYKAVGHWYTVGKSLSQYLEEKDCPKNYTGNWQDSLHEIMDGKLIKVKK